MNSYIHIFEQSHKIISRIRQFPPKILISLLPDAATNCLHPASDNRYPAAVIRGGRQKTIIDIVEQIVIVANKF